MATETYITTGGKPTITKDPEAVLDYAFDWGPWLKGVSDTIQDASFKVDPSLTVESDAHDDTTATVWLSGGTPPATGSNSLQVTCHIVTVGGRTDERTVYLKIADR